MKKTRYLLLVLIIAVLAAMALTACNTEYTITYYLDESTVYRTDKFSMDGSIDLPPDPTDDENDFSGWYLDLDFEDEFKPENVLNYVASGKLSVYAKWTPKTTAPQTYQVKFFDFDESVIQVGGKDFQTVESGQAATAPANPHREGYYFTGWSLSFAEVTQNLNITAQYKLILNIAPENKTVVYGDAAPAFTLKYSTILDSELAAPALSGEAVFSCDYSAGDDAGQYEISVSGLSSSEYRVNFAEGTLTVNKKALTVAADNKTITYGEVANDFSAGFTGLISGDAFTACTFSTDYTQGDGADDYVITVTGAAETTNYAITYVNATLTVNKKALTVSVQNKTRVYGEANPAFDVTADGLIAGDNITFTASTTATATSATGDYAITIAEQNLANYNVTYNNATLTITAATLTVSGTQNKGYSADKGWSQNVWDGTSAITVSGLKNGDVLTGTLETSGIIAGTYETVANALGSDFVWSVPFTVLDTTQNDVSSNYNLEYQIVINITYSIDLTVVAFEGDYDGNQHSISITVENIAQGNYEITYSTDGETFSAVNPSFVNVGVYTVYYTVTATNYTTASGSAVLQISKKSLTVTANNETIDYNAAAPDYSATVDGLVGGDTFSGYTLSCDYVQGNNPGGYAIAVSGPDRITNYAITYVNGTLTVSKAQYSGLTHGNILSQYIPNATLNNLSSLLDANWKWADSSETLNIGTYTKEILFNDNSAIYEDFNFMVTLVISKADVTIAQVAEAVLLRDQTVLTSQIAAGIYCNGTLVEGAYAYGDGSGFSRGTTAYASFSFAGNEYYNPVTSTIIVKIKTVDINGTYYTIEDALKASESGDTAIVKVNTDFCSNTSIISAVYNSDVYYTIKAGVLLLLPYDDSFSDSNTAMATNNTHCLGVVTYVELSAWNISLTISGTLMVNGLTARWNSASSNYAQQGQTGDRFSHLMLSKVNITVKNGGSLIANGYIIDNDSEAGVRDSYTPSSNIVAESGATIQDLLSIHDHRATTSLVSIYTTVFPYNQYTLHNIEANVRINYGANYNVRWTIIFAQNDDERNTGIATYIGSNQSALYQMTSGYATKSFNKFTARNTIDFYGNVKTNDFKVSVKVAGLTREVSTQGLFFPLFGGFTINVKSGVFTVGTNMKLLPGVRFNVESGAKLVVSSGKQMVAYDENQYEGIWSAAYNGGSTGAASYPIFGDYMIPLNIGFWFKDEGFGWDFAASEKAYVTVKGELIAYGNYGGPISVVESGKATFLGGTTADFKETSSASATKTMTATVPDSVLNALNKITVFGINGNVSASKNFYFSENSVSDYIKSAIALSSYEVRLFTDSALTVPAADEYSTNTTLFAGYYRNVTFMFDDSTSEEVEQRLNGNFVLPSRFEHGGKTISGYYYNFGLVKTHLPAGFDGTILTAYAYYNETVTITFDPQGGTLNNPTHSQQPDLALDVSQIVPAKENHDFDGWFYDAACLSSFTNNTVIFTDTTLYAKWSLQTVITSIDEAGASTSKYIARNATFTIAERPVAQSGYVYFWHSDTFAHNDLLIGGSAQVINYIAQNTTFKLVKYSIVDGTGTLTKGIADAITGEENLYITGYTIISNNAFQGRADIKRIILVDVVTIEDGSATVQTSSFSSAPTPSNVIGAFNGCTNLISAYMLKIETIGCFAFFGLGDNFKQAVILTDTQPVINVFRYGTYSSGTIRRAAYAYAFGRAFYISASNDYGAASTSTTTGAHGANANIKIYVKTSVTYDSYWGVYSNYIVRV